MSTLYELTEAYQELLSMALDPDTDPEALADTMEAIDGEIEAKIDGYVKVMREVKANAETRRAEAKRLLDSARSLESHYDSMNNALYWSMKATGKTKVRTELFDCRVQKNPPSLKIDMPDRVPDEFLIPQEPKVDSAAIKKELKEGVVYDWCHLEQSESLRIR